MFKAYTEVVLAKIIVMRKLVVSHLEEDATTNV